MICIQQPEEFWYPGGRCAVCLVCSTFSQLTVDPCYCTTFLQSLTKRSTDKNNLNGCLIVVGALTAGTNKPSQPFFSLFFFFLHLNAFSVNQ